MNTEHSTITMLEQPDIRPFATRTGWAYKLISPYIYEWVMTERNLVTLETKVVRRRLIVMAGFEHDGASAPRPLWSLTGIERDGLQRAAALIHDAFYRSEGMLGNGIIQEIWNDGTEIWEAVEPAEENRWSREAVDRLFCRMLREAGVPVVRRRMMFRGVRCFGWLFWNPGEVLRKFVPWIRRIIKLGLLYFKTSRS